VSVGVRILYKNGVEGEMDDTDHYSSLERSRTKEVWRDPKGLYRDDQSTIRHAINVHLPYGCSEAV
jgi:hypothetical protein